MVHFLKLHFQKINVMFNIQCPENKEIKHNIVESSLMNQLAALA